MTDREKTIMHLKAYVNCYAARHKTCNQNCVLYNHGDCAKYVNESINDAIELLQEQRPMKARTAKMDNREKTIAAFEKCIKLDDEGELYSDCEHCPYKSEERKLKGEAACESLVDLDVIIPYQLAAEMLELVKSQVPRVLTLKEVCDDYQVVYLERNINGSTDSCSVALVENINMYFILLLFGLDNLCYFSCNDYGRVWRCWSSRPTDEQREAVKWDS